MQHNKNGDILNIMSKYVERILQKFFKSIDKTKKRNYNLEELYNFSNIIFFLKIKSVTFFLKVITQNLIN